MRPTSNTGGYQTRGSHRTRPSAAPGYRPRASAPLRPEPSPPTTTPTAAAPAHVPRTFNPSASALPAHAGTPPQACRCGVPGVRAHLLRAEPTTRAVPWAVDGRAGRRVAVRAATPFKWTRGSERGCDTHSMAHPLRGTWWVAARGGDDEPDSFAEGVAAAGRVVGVGGRVKVQRDRVGAAVHPRDARAVLGVRGSPARATLSDDTASGGERQCIGWRCAIGRGRPVVEAVCLMHGAVSV